MSNEAEEKAFNILLAERMKQTRISLGYGQHSIANALGITVMSYSGLEAGRKKIRVFQLYRFCEFVKISPNHLLHPVFASLNYYKDHLRIIPQAPMLLRPEDIALMGAKNG